MSGANRTGEDVRDNPQPGDTYMSGGVKLTWTEEGVHMHVLWTEIREIWPPARWFSFPDADHKGIWTPHS